MSLFFFSITQIVYLIKRKKWKRKNRKETLWEKIYFRLSQILTKCKSNNDLNKKTKNNTTPT